MKPYIQLMKHFIRHNQFQECEPPTATGDYWITLRTAERYSSASRIENTHSDISKRGVLKGEFWLTAGCQIGSKTRRFLAVGSSWQATTTICRTKLY